MTAVVLTVSQKFNIGLHSGIHELIWLQFSSVIGTAELYFFKIIP